MLTRVYNYVIMSDAYQSSTNVASSRIEGGVISGFLEVNRSALSIVPHGILGTIIIMPA